MSITFTWGDGIQIRERSKEEKNTLGARGLLKREDLYPFMGSLNVNMETGELINIIGRTTGGIAIELNPALSEAERQYMIENGPKTPDYGTKWRAWWGDPLPEQMATEPWPELTEVEP